MVETLHTMVTFVAAQVPEKVAPSSHFIIAHKLKLLAVSAGVVEHEKILFGYTV